MIKVYTHIIIVKSFPYSCLQILNSSGGRLGNVGHDLGNDSGRKGAGGGGQGALW